MDSVFKEQSITYTNQRINYTPNQKNKNKKHFTPLVNSHPFYSKYEDKTGRSATLMLYNHYSTLICPNFIHFQVKLGIV